MTRVTWIAVVLFALTPIRAAAQAHQHGQQYAGQQTRTIKALDEKAVQDYLTGAGLGFALAAELNSYPGPRHALELADSLRLTAEQRTAITAVRDTMQRAAIALGEQIVELEKELDGRFAHRHIDPATLARLTSRTGELNGQLRAVHLNAHLQVTALLTADQIATYNRLRGYR